MHSNFNSRAITVLILVAAGLILAFNAGNWIADENYNPIAIIIGGLLGVLIYFGFGPLSYLLIPICYGLTGQISVLPLPFSVRQLAILLATGVFVSGLIFKSKIRKPSLTMVDLFLFLNIIYLGIVFLRNPVGVNALGSQLVGGKPYFDFLLGIMSYVILSRCVISAKEAKIVVSWSVILSVAVALICTVILFQPAIGKVLGKLYSAFSSWGINESDGVTLGETRLTPLQGGGIALILLCLSYIDPMRMLAPGYWRYLTCYFCGVYMVLLSGFRSAIFEILLLTGVATFLRSRSIGLVRMVCGLFFVAILLTGATFANVQLPLTAQRALCFLPGNWDPQAVKAADDSSQWRFRMWELMMTTDYYIRSKVWGDGYGFTRREFEIMLGMKQGGRGFGGEDAHLEPHLIQGTVHSGPISTIKRVGYFGLGLLLIFMGSLAGFAYHTLKKARGTRYELITYYYALPAIITPLVFLFIFGDYNDITFMMFNLGMLKMISSSITNANVDS